MLHARLLSYIDEIVRQGSIRRAAEKLNIAPSAISRQVLALEAQLGVPLFDRSERRLKPTAAGELLVRHVRDTLKDMSLTRRQIEELKGLQRGSVGIGLMSGLAANIVPHALTAFRETHPRIEVRLALMTTGNQILSAVEHNTIELGLGFDFPRRPGVRVLHSASGRLGAVMRPEHPLAQEPGLRLGDCMRYPLVLADASTAIRPLLDRAFESAGLRPPVAVETNSIEMMRQFAIIGDTIVFLTPFDIDGELRLGRLVFVPLIELAHHEQTLMLIQSDRRSDALASMVGARLEQAIAEIDGLASSR